MLAKPLVKLNGGYVSYQFNYRTAIDTPYVEKNIAQHNITGNLSLTLAGHLPVRVTWWSRQSNSGSSVTLQMYRCLLTGQPINSNYKTR
ncbi:hypothetical protein [Paraflavitalea speifideaquila]|uniref:hypothetical protein n=1 Tax=Paraflavitalea speifideaquila TaxID=3076558 RepID=UPI0028ED09C6|nr:hypothetical protein [Paraflavitalea speifideiaquila]